MESSCLLVMIIIHQSYAGCPFGNPFYFLEVPNVNNVRTPEGEILPNRWVVLSLNRSLMINF